MLWKCLVVVCALSVATTADNLGFNPCPGLTGSTILPDNIFSTQCTQRDVSSNFCKLFLPPVFVLQLQLDVQQFDNFSAIVTTKNIVTMSDSPVTLNNNITCNDLVDSTAADNAGSSLEICSIQIDTSPLFTGTRGFCFSFISKTLQYQPLSY